MADVVSNADYLLADLSADADVERLAQGSQREYARLDVLISTRDETVDGIERIFALDPLNDSDASTAQAHAANVCARSRGDLRPR